MLKERIESRLNETQKAFLVKCQKQAEEIFEANNIILTERLDATHKRLDEVDGNNAGIKAKFDVLFESNEEAVRMHQKIETVFEEEAQAFFAERLKWKSDAKQELETQNQRLGVMRQVTGELASKMSEYTENFSTMTDVMLMTFLLQSNVVSSMNQLNVMAGTIEQPAPIPYPPDTKLASSPRSEEAQEVQNRYKTAEAFQYPAN